MACSYKKPMAFLHELLIESAQHSLKKRLTQTSWWGLRGPQRTKLRCMFSQLDEEIHLANSI